MYLLYLDQNGVVKVGTVNGVVFLTFAAMLPLCPTMCVSINTQEVIKGYISENYSGADFLNSPFVSLCIFFYKSAADIGPAATGSAGPTPPPLLH